jgi:hypothetical protein
MLKHLEIWTNSFRKFNLFIHDVIKNYNGINFNFLRRELKC